MKAYMELVNNMLLTAEVQKHTQLNQYSVTTQLFSIFLGDVSSLQLYIQWCDDATAAEVCIPVFYIDFGSDYY